MTREQQLVFCKTCTNRKLDLKQGLICSLTGEKAAFENECADHDRDPEVPDPVEQQLQTVEAYEMAEMLNAETLEKLRAEQNFGLGIIGASVAGLIGAALWGLITVTTEYQIGFMAIGIGFIVGIGMRQMGKGVDKQFGIAGAIIALISVVLGNVLSVIGFIAIELDMSFFETLFGIDYAYLPEVMIDTFSPIDILFYAFAVIEGYKFSFRQLSAEDVGV